MPDTSTSRSAYLAGGNKRTTSAGAQVEYRDSTNYRRSTNVGVNVEYRDLTNYKRTTGIGANVEYVDTTNYRRVTTVGVMVEYALPTATHLQAYLFGNILAGGSQAVYMEGTGSIQTPSSDLAVNEWTNQLGGSILYTSLFEIDPNDNTYVTKDDPQPGDYFEERLADIAEGFIGTGQHTLEFRARCNTGQVITIRVELRKDGQALASSTQTLTSDYITYEHILSQQEIDAIIDGYNELSLRIVVVEVF